MTKHLAFCLLLFALSGSLHAQCTLSGTVANYPTNAVRQLALEFWSTDHWQQTEIIYLNPDNSFSTTMASMPPAQYRLRAWAQAKRWNDFIMGDSTMTDVSLNFQLEYAKMDGGPAKMVGSASNDLYFELMNAQQRFAQLRDSSSNATPAQIETAVTALNKICKNTHDQHRNTFIGDIALLLYDPQQSDYPANSAAGKMSANEFVKAHALEHIPFQYDNILNHNAFLKLLNRYFNYFDRDPAGNKAYIDGIMARRNGNETVDAFVFKYLLDKMMDYKQEEGLTYLLNWYAPDCTDENPLPGNTQNLVEALKTCAPGKIAPDIGLPNLDGQQIALGETCAGNKLTLMLFWRSTCPHCKAFEPELEKIYEKYHPLGVEVYALSTDKTEEDWRNDLKTHLTPWVNVFIPQERRREISRHYPAPSTPTLIALDAHRRVLNRVLSRGNLEQYLDEELKKLQGQ